MGEAAREANACLGEETRLVLGSPTRATYLRGSMLEAADLPPPRASEHGQRTRSPCQDPTNTPDPSG